MKEVKLLTDGGDGMVILVMVFVVMKFLSDDDADGVGICGDCETF